MLHAAETIEEQLALATKTLPFIQLEQSVYQGYDDGESCNTEKAQPEITVIDKDKDRKEQLSFCFKVTNTSQAWLSNITLTGIKPELIHNDFLPITAELPELLAPNTSIMFYTEYLLEESLLGQFMVEAEVVDKEGNPLLMERAAKAVAVIKADLIVDPPIVNKTVLPKGGKGMLWQLELVNNSDQQTMSVSVFDNIPENTIHEVMPAGDFVSESGIYCKAMGASITEACYVESAAIGYPQGRIVWKGKIASDFTKSAEEAENKVIVRFISNAPEAEIGDVISSQARTLWGDNQNEVLSDNPATPENPADATTYKIHKPIEPEPEVIQIPTLSQWGLLLLSVILLLLVRFRVLFIKQN